MAEESTSEGQNSVLWSRVIFEDKAFPTPVSCSFPDVGEPAAVGKRCALFALQRDVRGL